MGRGACCGQGVLSRFVHVNTIGSIDLKTGRPNYVDAKKPTVGKTVRDICPHAGGGKDYVGADITMHAGPGRYRSKINSSAA